MPEIQIEDQPESLILRLPWRPLRLARNVGGLAVAFALVILLVIWKSHGWLCPVFGFGFVFGSILAFLYLTTATPLLTQTTARITRDSVEIEKQRFGRRPNRKSYSITDESRAYKWYDRQRVGGDSTPQPQGIEVGEHWENVERSVHEVAKNDRPRFGWSLSESEMDDLIGRVNAFLDRVRRKLT